MFSILFMNFYIKIIVNFKIEKKTKTTNEELIVKC